MRNTFEDVKKGDTVFLQVSASARLGFSDYFNKRFFISGVVTRTTATQFTVDGEHRFYKDSGSPINNKQFYVVREGHVLDGQRLQCEKVQYLEHVKTCEDIMAAESAQYQLKLRNLKLDDAKEAAELLLKVKEIITRGREENEVD